jgi:hypothetical protein
MTVAPLTMKKAMTMKKTTKKGTKKATTSNRKKRIRVAIVGSDSVTPEQAKDSAEYLLPKLLTKYDLTRVATVKEDLLGRAIRKVAKRLELKTTTFTAEKWKGESQALELATAQLFWEAKRFIVVIGHGRIEGCARYAMEMVGRSNLRKIKILELKD